MVDSTNSGRIVELASIDSEGAERSWKAVSRVLAGVGMAEGEDCSDRKVDSSSIPVGWFVGGDRSHSPFMSASDC